MTTLTDDQLILQLQGEATRRKAFDLLVKKFTSQLYWQIRQIVVVHEDADDALQNTFMKAWGSLDSFRGEAKLSTWLYRIAVNESLTVLKRRRSEASIDDADLNIASHLEADPYFDGDETDLMLQRAVASLPDKQRLVFNMKYFQEMKYEEMSAVLQTSVGALKASYHFAVEKIEKFFNEHD